MAAQVHSRGELHRRDAVRLRRFSHGIHVALLESSTGPGHADPVERTAERFKPAQRVSKHADAQEPCHLEERHFRKQNPAQTSEGNLCFHLTPPQKKSYLNTIRAK